MIHSLKNLCFVSSRLILQHFITTHFLSICDHNCDTNCQTHSQISPQQSFYNILSLHIFLPICDHNRDTNCQIHSKTSPQQSFYNTLSLHIFFQFVTIFVIQTVKYIQKFRHNSHFTTLHHYTFSFNL